MTMPEHERDELLARAKRHCDSHRDVKTWFDVPADHPDVVAYADGNDEIHVVKVVERMPAPDEDRQNVNWSAFTLSAEEFAELERTGLETVFANRPRTGRILFEIYASVKLSDTEFLTRLLENLPQDYVEDKSEAPCPTPDVSSDTDELLQVRSAICRRIRETESNVRFRSDALASVPYHERLNFVAYESDEGGFVYRIDVVDAAEPLPTCDDHLAEDDGRFAAIREAMHLADDVKVSYGTVTVAKTSDNRAFLRQYTTPADVAAN